MFMAFTTAILTSVLIDYPPPPGVLEKRWRFAEAAIQGALTMVSALFVRWWLADIQPVGSVLPNPTAVCVVSAFAGMVLGFIVPSWYRQAKRKEQTASGKKEVSDLVMAAHR
jgi:ABC-type transport system involved in cytochrome c biogenesis permease subunit